MTIPTTIFALVRSTLLAATAVLFTAGSAQAAVNKTLCVYDPSGAAGPTFQHAKAYKNAAVAWGVNFALKPYTDEAVAAADFRNSQCDAALITGVRVQQFNRKTYSVEALGLYRGYAGLKKTIAVLSKTKAASLNKDGDFETAGIFPAGMILLFVNDKSMNDASQLAGKKICTMSFDNAANTMVKVVGANPVPSDIGTFASKFNNGSCDVAYAPAAAYAPLELHKGIGSKGGIIDFPVAQLTLQILIRSANFPDGFGQQSRTYSAGQFDTVQAALDSHAAKIPAGTFVKIAGDDQVRYNKLLGDTRNQLIANGAYDPTVVKLGAQLSGN
jgi:hypothetical protein